MNALIGFEYKHGNKVVLDSSIGTIELTYMTRDGQKEDEKVLGGLFELVGDLPYDQAARNEPSFFQATLLDKDSQVRYIAYHVLPGEAVKELYRFDAVIRMEAEFYQASAA